MADPFIGEIRMFCGNFAPRNYAFCDGQLLPIAQYTALFSLLGTYYGGDGRTTFGLPDLRGRFAMQQGQGAGLSLRDQGETGGAAEVTLFANEIPPHSHALMASALPGTTAVATTTPRALFAAPPDGQSVYGPAADLLDTAPQMVTPAGGGTPHPNRQPYLGLTFIIAVQGIFPPRG